MCGLSKLAAMAMKVPRKQKLCFVVGPIGADDTDVRVHADWLLEEIVQPVMAKYESFVVKRADQDPRPGLIDAQMINDLLTADLVIADLSGQNPNAFYEIGIRHMAQKPIIHMQLSGETVPFDLSLFRAIKFSRTTPKDIRAARDALKSQVDAVLEDGYEVENPVTNARGRVQLDERATEPQRVMLDRLDAIERRLASLPLPEAPKSEPSLLFIRLRENEWPPDVNASRVSRLIHNIAGGMGGASTGFSPEKQIVRASVSKEAANVLVRRLTEHAAVESVDVYDSLGT